MTNKRPLKEAVSGNWSEDEIKKLFDALDSFEESAQHLSEVLEVLSDSDRDINDLIVNGYPFEKSFDEVVWDIDAGHDEVTGVIEESRN